MPTHAQRLSYTNYVQGSGLANVSVRCLVQERAGYLLACTENGLYIFDGVRFTHLGVANGLPEDAILTGAVVGRTGQIFLHYYNSVFVSDAGASGSSDPQTWHFRKAVALGQVASGLLPKLGTSDLTPWEDGVLVNASGALLFVAPAEGAHDPTISSTVPDLLLERPLRRRAHSIMAAGNRVWITYDDGQICALDAHVERCFGLAEGLPAEKWAGMLADGPNRILVRSASSLASLDLDTGRATSETLPGQGGRWGSYPTLLMLARTPAGHLITQAADGLIMKTASGWETVGTRNGLPSVTIASVMFDRNGQLWLGTLGRGVLRIIGFGMWRNFGRSDGLSDDIVWSTNRQPDGPIWIATDTGVDRLPAAASPEEPPLHLEGAGYLLGFTGRDVLWRTVGDGEAECTNLRTMESASFHFGSVTSIVPVSPGRLWFTTQFGVYEAREADGCTHVPVRLPGLNGAIVGASKAADGHVWMLRRKQLLRVALDGTIDSAPAAWPTAGQLPLVVAAQDDHTVWVGGAGGGLYRFNHSGDRLIDVVNLRPPDVISSTIVALLVDHRGWLWVGTDQGLSVYDGTRWASVNATVGLVWDDINQSGLFEDKDGTIWIATTQGLSHLLDPDFVFRQKPLHPVITRVILGSKTFAGRATPYTREPLLINFGALNFQESGSIRFRYRLDGVDHGWAEAEGGTARYPSVPPGHHMFSVVAYDPLTHQVSEPATILLRMKEPWWLWWPLQLLYVVGIVLCFYAVIRLRYLYLLRQRQALQDEVRRQTAEIRAAQAALLLQATQDSLTGLLTRSELQKRLSEILDQPLQPLRLTIGLLDIDHFKRINDRFGHLAGDHVLREIGQRLRVVMLPGEFAGRYGGEEILVVLQHDRHESFIRLEELNKTIRNAPVRVDGDTIHVTCSIGVAQARPHDDWESLVRRADRALYHAKAQGRDRVVLEAINAA